MSEHIHALTMENNCADCMREKANRLESKLKKARAALEFYVDHDNWMIPIQVPGEAMVAVKAGMVKWRIAEQALAEIGEIE